MSRMFLLFVHDDDENEEDDIKQTNKHFNGKSLATESLCNRQFMNRMENGYSYKLQEKNEGKGIGEEEKGGEEGQYFIDCQESKFKKRNHPVSE